MATLTRQLDIAGSWTDLSAGLALVDGTAYAVDIAAADGTVFWAETDAADAPGAILGHPWYPASRNAGTDTRTYDQRAGVHLWLKCAGSAVISVTPRS